MPDPIKRTETTHIDEVSRKATSTVQWLAENRNKEGSATHPISHNNKLTVFMAGEESFADIAEHIRKAEGSIDLCCWGFDPGMELVRGKGATWPRGETYGDLLIAAGKRGVKVRLLVWYDALAVAAQNPCNMPGHTHDTNPWCTCHGGEAYAKRIGAQHSVTMLRNYRERYVRPVGNPGDRKPSIRHELFPVSEAQAPVLARAEYCHSWYFAGFDNQLENIQIRTRTGEAGAIAASLKTEPKHPKVTTPHGIERQGMVRAGTHHQKPILIDFAHDNGAKAVGYVMGLNSVTDYWDTNQHLLEDPRREQGGALAAKEYVQGKKNDTGYRSMKPYHDYACRIDGGLALVALYNNFVVAWDRAGKDMLRTASSACLSPRWDSTCHGVPSALSRRAEPGDSTVQIVRTQPEEKDTTIREVYFQATDIAALAAGYLYVENQYFQYEAWAQRLMQTRERVIAAWNRGCAKAGKDMEDLPVMHVFVVIPVPERAQMIPRTYDTLAVLGQQEAMTGQSEMIKDANAAAESPNYDPLGNPVSGSSPLPEVVQHANDIEKPDTKVLESRFGLRISVAMLNTCAFVGGRWRYREVYIHSKLMLVDDVFLTLGSANLNQRSMAVDSEINLATVDPNLAESLRRRVWLQHSGGRIDGGDGKPTQIAEAYEDWIKLMKVNRKKKMSNGERQEERKMTGFLLPLEDERSSTIRLG